VLEVCPRVVEIFLILMSLNFALAFVIYFYQPNRIAHVSMTILIYFDFAWCIIQYVGKEKCQVILWQIFKKNGFTSLCCILRQSLIVKEFEVDS